MADRPYSRVYWSVMDDAKFDGIREHPNLLGSWLVLLVMADMAWPTAAYVPHVVPSRSFQVLVDAGLIDPLSGGRYRVHGMHTERTARSNAARNAAAVRWHQNGNAETMPRRDETRQDEKTGAQARTFADRAAATKRQQDEIRRTT